MSRDSHPLPEPFDTDAFRVADARAAGVGEGRLRGSDLAKPYRGVRALQQHAQDPVVARCLMYTPLLRPGQFFSHLTAARLWGCPLPHPFSETEPLHVSTIAPARAPRGVGIIGHQANTPGAALRQGLPVSDPVSTWLSLATLLSLDDLVAVGDHLILDPVVQDPHESRPHTNLARLAAGVRAHSGRGVRAAASALPLLRLGSESRPETVLRLLLGRAGLPEPAINIAVTDASGRALGRGDLVFTHERTVVEYDGDHHRTSTRQYDRDMTRIESFMLAGWKVVRVRKHDLCTRPEQIVSRVRRALVARE